MLLIRCPFCEMDRPEIEFRYAGEAHLDRPEGHPNETDEAWSAFLYTRANPRGVHAERWRHAAGCGRYFNALRHTVSDRFLVVYKPGEPRPAIEGEGA